ncbi:hypothetical protein LTR51_000242 [Lithohypha guttulata]|nr:hypothetical protein LTR51_000242 [Lithohypha guttulata]
MAAAESSSTPAARVWYNTPTGTRPTLQHLSHADRQRDPLTKPLRGFSSSTILRRLKPYDPEYEDGLTFRDDPLNEQELATIFVGLHIEPEEANRLLKVLHARRVDGTLDVSLDEDLSTLLDTFPQSEELALTWLRNTYPVDEDAAILSRFQREESPREQENPSALMERGQRLGLFKTQDQSIREDPTYYGPQSGAYYSQLSEKQGDVFGRSELEELRAANEAKAEEEENTLQQQIDQSMAQAEAQAQIQSQKQPKKQSQALERAPEQGIELADGRHVRPPNEFEKWIIRAQQKASTGFTLDSPEIANLTTAGRILPSLLFVLVSCAGLYLFAQYWEPPRRSDRLMPNVSLSVATCSGILAANVLVFCLWRFPPALRLLNQYFLVNPAYPYWFSMFGKTFSHYSFRHLLYNMVSLFIFGPSLHEDIGRGNFLAIYLAAGLLGSLVSMSSFVLRGILYTSSQGASGCTWGIMSAYMWLHKDDNFSLIFIPKEYQGQVYAKGWMLLGALVVYDVVVGLRKKTIDVAAHWTGIVVGIAASSAWKVEHGDTMNREARPGLLANFIEEIQKKFTG